MFAAIAALIVLSLIRWDPERWWILAAVVFTAILVLARAARPTVLMPLFYDITPLTREVLRDRWLRWPTQRGPAYVGVFEWRLSDRTKQDNAALAGLGRTRRILLSDRCLPSTQMTRSK